MSEILYCSSCKTYTLKQICPKCSLKTLSNKPAKYSPEDKWGKWRRIFKKEHEK